MKNRTYIPYFILSASLFIAPQRLSCSEVLASATELITHHPLCCLCGYCLCAACCLACVEDSSAEKARKQREQEAKEESERQKAAWEAKKKFGKESLDAAGKVVKLAKDCIELAQGTKDLFSSSKNE